MRSILLVLSFLIVGATLRAQEIGPISIEATLTPKNAAIPPATAKVTNVRFGACTLPLRSPKDYLRVGIRIDAGSNLIVHISDLNLIRPGSPDGAGITIFDAQFPYKQGQTVQVLDSSEYSIAITINALGQ